jgi:aminoglycoside phosphotransferase (APT) family kinase protein
MLTTSATMRFVTMHEGQLSVTAEMAGNLVGSQFREYAGLQIEPVRSEGTVNAIFRIGEHLAARFPLRPDDVDATRRRLETEAGAARELRGHTRVPVPEPVAMGEPGAGYPLPWSIQTWLPGATASGVDTSTSDHFAHDLAEFIQQVRSIDVAGRTFTGNRRGGDLRSHDSWVQTCFEESTRLVDVPRLRQMWDRLRQLPRNSPDAMTHGDLIPGNVLVSRGRLTGILDVGGLGPADPALDLVAAWHLLDSDRRRVLRDDLGCDDLEWERGKAWALEQAIGAIWYYIDSNPPMHRMGRRTLERILTGE